MATSSKRDGDWSSQPSGSKPAREPWYTTWTQAFSDRMIVFDQHDVFGTGQRFILSSQASLVYEGLFDPLVRRDNKERHQLVSLRLFKNDQVHQACVFSRAGSGGSHYFGLFIHAEYTLLRNLLDVSRDTLHCVCRALEADLTVLVENLVDPGIAYKVLCYSACDPPTRVHR